MGVARPGPLQVASCTGRRPDDTDDAALCLPFIPYCLSTKDLRFDEFGGQATFSRCDFRFGAYPVLAKDGNRVDSRQ